MSAEHTRQLLERILDPVWKCLTKRSARRLLALRADPELQSRLDVLARKCNEGELTADEKAEYEAYVRAIQFVTVLQSKARRSLGKSRTP